MTVRPSAKTVSACLIVRNEERCLARCLTSLKGAVDEIVVVDTGSTDRTIEIARAHGAKVDSFAWCDDFAAARNAALDLATGDWVLSIDADEWLANDATRWFVRRVAACAPPRDAFVPFMTVGDGFRTYANVRLFHRHGTRWEYRVHEQVRLPHEAPDIIRHDDFEFGHDGYDTTVVAPGAKTDRNRPLIVRLREESEPGSPAWIHATIFLAQVLLRPYAPDDERLVAEAILISAPKHEPNCQLLTLRLYRQWIEAGRFDELNAFNERAMAAGAAGPLNHLVRAVKLVETGETDAAREALAKAQSAKDDYFARKTLAPLFANVADLLGTGVPA